MKFSTAVLGMALIFAGGAQAGKRDRTGPSCQNGSCYGGAPVDSGYSSRQWMSRSAPPPSYAPSGSRQMGWTEMPARGWSSSPASGYVPSQAPCAGGVCRPPVLAGGGRQIYPLQANVVSVNGVRPPPGATGYSLTENGQVVWMPQNQQPEVVDAVSAPSQEIAGPARPPEPLKENPFQGGTAPSDRLVQVEWSTNQAARYDSLLEAENKSIVLVDFYTLPCAHCETVKKLMQGKLSQKYGAKVAFYQVRIQDEPEAQIAGSLRDRAEIRDLVSEGYPALLLIKKVEGRWEPVEQWNGVFDEAQFAEKFEKAQRR